jgi:Leucine-rich repeat (LRR) protein
MHFSLVILLAVPAIFQVAQGAKCTFRNVWSSYTCQLENQIIRNNDDLKVIGGVHIEGRVDSNVKQLESNSSIITFFPSQIVDHFENLGFLYLRNVEMKTFDRAIVNCKELSVIDLDENKIEVVPAGIFRACLKLRSFSLSFNQIKAISDDAFDGLSNLDSLWLSYNNNIKSISRQLFKNTPMLSGIFLGYNEIEEIAAGTFDDLPDLSWVSVGNNKITKWSKEILSQNPKMTVLELNGNQIRNFDADTFSNLPELIDLKLGDFMEEIPVFEGVQRLERLTILNCRFSNLSAASFAYMDSLSFLYIGNGLVETFDFSMTTPRILTNLKTLYLSNNSISTLEGSSLEMLTGLKTLGLAQNQISRLTYDTLKPVLPLEFLYIDDNQMSFIDRQIIENSTGMQVSSQRNQCFHGGFKVDESLEMIRLQRCFNSGLSIKANGFVLLVAAFVTVFLKVW